MAKQSQVSLAIEKAKAEIAFQQRLIDALEATQKAQSTTSKPASRVSSKRRRTSEGATTDSGDQPA